MSQIATRLRSAQSEPRATESHLPYEITVLPAARHR